MNTLCNMSEVWKYLREESKGTGVKILNDWKVVVVRLFLLCKMYFRKDFEMEDYL